MSPCDREQLLLLAAGELDAGQAAALERHVADCPACALELSGLRRTLAQLDRLPALEPSGAAGERIRAAGREAIAGRRTAAAKPAATVTRSVYRYRFALLAAACVAVVVGLSFMLSRHTALPPGLDWNHAAAEVAASSNQAEDLAESIAADPWTGATSTLIVDLSSTDVSGKLLELDESLDLLQGGSPKGSPRL